MAIFGPDLSSYQHGVNVAALAGAAFVLAKCTEGVYYADADYNGWRSQTRSVGKLFAAYHFLKTESTAAAQAAWTKAHLGDPTLPVMVDVETEGPSMPRLADVVDYVDACAAIGVRVKLAYVPRWFWSQIGSPNLTPLSARGVGLISSAYPGGSGYPGDNAAGWLPYGGVTPTLYQYTDAAVEGGQAVGDMNAYRGSLAQLAAFLGSPAPPPIPATTTQGDTVGTIPASIAAKWPEIAGEFPANATFDSDTALIWSDAGSRAAALHAAEARDAANWANQAAGQARDAANSLSAKLDALAAAVSQPPTIDVNALAAAIAPHLAAGATADVIAAAVLHHLSTATANG
jgi:lysozyme